MSKTMTATRLEQLRIEAKTSGNHPEKVAKYVAAKHAFDTLVDALFDEENPYLNTPSDRYLARLKAKADETGTEVDTARYNLVKERWDIVDRRKRGEDVREHRDIVSELRQVLQSGAEITEDHIKAAGQVVVRNSSIDNLVLVSTLKQRRQAQKDGQTPPVEEGTQKITQADVDAAYEKVKRTSSITDRAAYATLKHQFALQESEGAAE